MGILKKLYYFFIDLVEVLVIAGAIFVVIYAFLFRPFEVNGQSMFPNYHNGDYILTNIIGLRFSKPERGDIIVFKAPLNQEKDYIKRVIGIPGDKVMVQSGNVYLNDKLLDESAYLPSDYKTYTLAFMKEGEAITVPQGSYFVLGDNREFSSDSREWGFVTLDKIIGKSFFVYWPPQRVMVIPQVEYKN